MRLHIGLVAALCGGGMVATANAGVTFSFSADSGNGGPTYQGSGTPAPPLNMISDFGAAPVIIDFIVDANGNEPGGATTFNSIFDFSGITTTYSALPFAGGFIHQWAVNGSFTFTHTGTGLEVLQIDFNNALFSSFSSSATGMGSTATLQASEALDGGLNFTAGAPLAGLGITDADLDVNENFSFGLSDLHAMGPNPSAPLTIGAGGSWLQSWLANASFTAGAGAGVVPAPGAIALLAIAGWIGIRGRRRTLA